MEKGVLRNGNHLDSFRRWSTQAAGSSLLVELVGTPWANPFHGMVFYSFAHSYITSSLLSRFPHQNACPQIPMALHSLTFAQFSLATLFE